jgi:hypothetical protein
MWPMGPYRASLLKVLNTRANGLTDSRVEAFSQFDDYYNSPLPTVAHPCYGKNDGTHVLLVFNGLALVFFGP